MLDGGGEQPAAPALRPAAPVERIVERVERERGLRFDARARARRGDARAGAPRGARVARRGLPAGAAPRRRRGARDARAVPPGTDLGEAVASTLGEAVAGYYDPREQRLRIVQGAQTANRVLYEMVLAHELTHALEDQRFDFDLDVLAAGGDRALAYTALIEGSASAVMYRYVDAALRAPEELFGGLAASAFGRHGRACRRS